jgi:hypothetical protein
VAVFLNTKEGVMQRQFVGIAITALFIGVPAAAQQPAEERAASVARIYTAMAKDGHTAQLEDGMKKHFAWHRNAGDQGGWHVWNVITGPEAGSYLVGTFGRSWADLEKTSMGEKDHADVLANIAPHASQVTNRIWVFRGDISPRGEGDPPTRFTSVVNFHMKPEGLPVLEGVIRQVTDAMMKLPAQDRGVSPPMIYQLVAGGEGPRLAMVYSADSWADMEPRGTTPLQALEKAYGEEEGREIMMSALKGIRYIDSQILQYRPDLSSPAAGSDN